MYNEGNKENARRIRSGRGGIKVKESEEMYIAHLNEQTGCAQSVKEHNENVAALCESFSIPPLKQLCFAIGNLHDIGKYCNAFQRRIKGENIHVDHSTAGAVVMQQQYQLITGILGGLCIAGHHAGIPDTGLSYDGIREPRLFMPELRKRKNDAKKIRRKILLYTKMKQPYRILMRQKSESL